MVKIKSPEWRPQPKDVRFAITDKEINPKIIRFKKLELWSLDLYIKKWLC